MAKLTKHSCSPKHRRRDKNVKLPCFWLDKTSTVMRRIYVEDSKAKARQLVRHINKGEYWVEDRLDSYHRTYRHTAKYDSW